MEDKKHLLPPRPIAPLPSDCCGTGCCPCVHDIYQEDMEDWKKTCKKIKDGNTDDSQNEDVINSTSYKSFEIVEIEPISTDSYIYTFHIDNNGCLRLNVGEHIILMQETDKGSFITRQYTPISDLDERGKFKLLIKIYDKGKMTQIIKEWKVGDHIPWRGPFGRFKYNRNSHKRILLLGAGTGIAPLYQIIKYILDNKDDESIIKLFYSNKSLDDILLKSELLELTSYWNFTMTHFLSHEKDLSKKKYREVVLGRFNKSYMKSYILSDDIDNILILLCGTKSYVKDMINFAKDLEVPVKNIFKF